MSLNPKVNPPFACFPADYERCAEPLTKPPDRYLLIRLAPPMTPYWCWVASWADWRSYRATLRKAAA